METKMRYLYISIWRIEPVDYISGFLYKREEKCQCLGESSEQRKQRTQQECAL